MSIADLFAEHFEDQKFGSQEEYNAEVMRFANSLVEDVGKEERYYIKNPEYICAELDTEIEGYDTLVDEEEQRAYEETSFWNDKEAQKTEQFNLTKGKQCGE